MAKEGFSRILEYTLTDNDYIAFNRYHVLNSKDGRALINKQRLIMFIACAGVFGLFMAFDVSHKLRVLVGIICAAVAVFSFIRAEKMVLNANEKAIIAEGSSIDRIHPPKNIVEFKGKSFSVKADESNSEFEYKSIYGLDMNEDGLYIWVDARTAMSIPMHAFQRRSEMKELYEFLKEKCGL